MIHPMLWMCFKFIMLNEKPDAKGLMRYIV